MRQAATNLLTPPYETNPNSSVDSEVDPWTSSMDLRGWALNVGLRLSVYLETVTETTARWRIYIYPSASQHPPPCWYKGFGYSVVRRFGGTAVRLFGGSAVRRFGGSVKLFFYTENTFSKSSCVSFKKVIFFLIILNVLWKMPNKCISDSFAKEVFKGIQFSAKFF